MFNGYNSEAFQYSFSFLILNRIGISIFMNFKIMYVIRNVNNLQKSIYSVVYQNALSMIHSIAIVQAKFIKN